MSWTFVIGKALGGRVVPCEGDAAAIHSDEWADDGAKRLPSYSGWEEVLWALPRFRALFETLEHLARSHKPTSIPCRCYEDHLDTLEQEASQAGLWEAARELWFVRWSREALRRYGANAAFETPGEWL